MRTNNATKHSCSATAAIVGCIFLPNPVSAGTQLTHHHVAKWQQMIELSQLDTDHAVGRPTANASVAAQSSESRLARLDSEKNTQDASPLANTGEEVTDSIKRNDGDAENVSKVAALFSALFAGLGWLSAFYFSSHTKKHQQFLARQSYAAKVMDWGSEVVAVMSECTTLCELDPQRMDDFFHRRNHLRTRLSELIDRGRWFFENEKTTGYGMWKPSAYQGIAQNILSAVKETLRLVEKLNYRELGDNRRIRQEIVDQKRKFVSMIQDFVEPEEVMKQLSLKQPNSDNSRA